MPAREAELLRWLATLGRLNTSQLERVLFSGCALRLESRRVMTNELLRSLRERGLIAAGPKLVGGPGGGSARTVYGLSDRGRRAAATLDPALAGARGARRSTIFLEHALMTAEVALAFLGAARSHPGHALSEWAADWQAASRLGSSRVVPDALLSYSTRAWEFDAFLEVDLDTERPSRFAEKVDAYLALYASVSWRRQLRAWPLLLVVAPTAARVGVLRRTTQDVLRRQRDAARLAAVVEIDLATIDDVRGPRGPLGAIWQTAGGEGRRALVPPDADAESEQPVPAAEVADAVSDACKPGTS